jgi:Glutamine amidotransferase class-I
VASRYHHDSGGTIFSVWLLRHVEQVVDVHVKPLTTLTLCSYEVNPEMVTELEAAGLRFVGKDETGQRMEILELPKSQHPFFLGVQYHPEFKSRPLKPSPPFFGLVAASINCLDAACRSLEDSGRLSRSQNGSGRLNGRLQDLHLSDPK